MAWFALDRLDRQRLDYFTVLQLMNAEYLQPLTPAFSRTARRMVFILAFFSILAFGVGSKTLLHLLNARHYAQQAELCSAALGASDASALPRRMNGLQSRTDRLIAVALLDSNGKPQQVFPDRSAHHSLMEKLAESPMSEFEITSPISDESQRVIGVPVMYQAAAFGRGAQMLVALRVDSDWKAWLPMMGSVTFAVFVIALLRLRTLQRWFDEQIAFPLGQIVGAVSELGGKGRPDETQLPPPRFRETARITETFQELLDSLSESHSKSQKLQREVAHRIKRHEAGMDMQLRRVRDQATTDPLTGLRNRRFLDEQLDALFELHQKRDAEFCAVMIDVDNFKGYNDSNGHQVGDALLRFLGALLRGSIRPTDHAVRYGGDEFLLLLPETKMEDAAAVTLRMIKLFGQYVSRLDNNAGLSMSAGVASLRLEKCDSGNALIARADAALYNAKFNGKNGLICGPVASEFVGRRELLPATSRKQSSIGRTPEIAGAS